jgi:hypothetical protein
VEETGVPEESQQPLASYDIKIIIKNIMNI